jgi:hypothetical protein
LQLHEPYQRVGHRWVLARARNQRGRLNHAAAQNPREAKANYFHRCSSEIAAPS